MTDIQGLKEKVQREIDEIAPLLIECSDWMADNPEIGLQEYQASAKLAKMLEESGAEVERGISEMPTAFRAALAGSSSGEPTIAMLAEYDALPAVGHGCGHNIIGNAAVGAGMALSTCGPRRTCFCRATASGWRSRAATSHGSPATATRAGRSRAKLPANTDRRSIASSMTRRTRLV